MSIGVQADAWVDEFIAWFLRRHPVDATFIGDHRHDGELPDFSASAVAEMLAEMGDLLARFQNEWAEDAALPTATDLALARAYLATREWELRSGHFQRGNPCIYTGEAIFGVAALFLTDFAPLDERVAAATRRMNAIPELLGQARGNIDVYRREWVARAISECAAADTLFSHGIQSIARQCPGPSASFLGAATRARDAFGAYRHFLEQQPLVELSAMESIGTETFARLLEEGHCLDVTTAQLMAQSEAQIAAELEALADGASSLVGTTDWKSALPSLLADAPAPDAYLETFADEWRDHRQHVIRHHIAPWLDLVDDEAPVTFDWIPDWAAGAAPQLYFLHYRSPAPLREPYPQRYLVPTPSNAMMRGERERFLRGVTMSQIRLNHVMHHAGLGHYVQNNHAMRTPSKIGRLAGVDCASRIAMFPAGTLVEGWACYAVDLIEEAGLSSRAESLAQHHSRLRMAARACVDVGLHTGSMTANDARQLYTGTVGISENAADAEVVRNSMFPGSALIYMVGTRAIHDLRQEMRSREGADFDLYRFHERLLSFGSVPTARITAAMLDAAPLA
jgi:hypothetical protein